MVWRACGTVQPNWAEISSGSPAERAPPSRCVCPTQLSSKRETFFDYRSHCSAAVGIRLFKGQPKHSRFGPHANMRSSEEQAAHGSSAVSPLASPRSLTIEFAANILYIHDRSFLRSRGAGHLHGRTEGS